MAHSIESRTFVRLGGFSCKNVFRRYTGYNIMVRRCGIRVGQGGARGQVTGYVQWQTVASLYSVYLPTHPER
jgi:hypothetical protein